MFSGKEPELIPILIATLFLFASKIIFSNSCKSFKLPGLILIFATFAEIAFSAKFTLK
jgi:hypothetical protein